VASKVIKLDKILLEKAIELTQRRDVAGLVFVSNLPFPDDLFTKTFNKKKLVVAVSADALKGPLELEEFQVVTIPHYLYSRIDRMGMAVASARSAGYFKSDATVVSVTGDPVNGGIDTLRVCSDEEYEQGTFSQLPEIENISPHVIQTIIELAVELGSEGWEGKAVGSIFVVGDTVQVMERSRQLTMNPFQGYSESERNIMDPTVREAIKNFATLDGAFIIREDGVVLAAGRFLDTVSDPDVEIPLGLGSRHLAAATLTAVTPTVTVAVSQTTGTARVFHQGQIIAEIRNQMRRVTGS
jgi:diadenylate cyclase